ncbi:MAG: dephospho-CoA kinase [Candidatus Aenigmarchaeota archaeon]|nr:dephospho-CoA kinase [Candidatus Aenigmarchaeota archaeon]
MGIICIAGLIGSGKDTAADYISKKYGYKIIDYANILREICKKEGLELSRDNLQNLRVKYGNTFLAEEAVKRIKDSGNRKIILTPMRRSEDFEIPKKEFGSALTLIVVDADPETRFKRLSTRGRENDPKDLNEFLRQEKRENEIFNFEKTFSYADFTIENDSGLKDLETKIDNVMKVIK